MPGQFINTGTNPDGKLSLTNVNNEGNLVLSVATTSPGPTLYADFNSGVSCAGGGIALPTYTYIGGTTFCDCTSLNAPNAVELGPAGYYVSDGTNARLFLATGGGSTLLTAATACFSC
jgi:hypothetical protein